MSVVGKVYGKVLMQRVREGSEGVIYDKQGFFLEEGEDEWIRYLL